MKVNLFIPTLNAGKIWQEVLAGIAMQNHPISRFVIIDSGSTDGTLNLINEETCDLIQIDKKDFDHGGTRQMAAETFPDADIFVFLTQDAILADPNAIRVMVEALEKNPELGMVYGRQLPHKNAKVLETHARLFNYPAESKIKSLEDADRYGIRTISCSNSFAAYRKTAFFKVNGFPTGSILGEDVLIAGKMLLDGWKMAYLSNSKIHHSHDYSAIEEFKRYFDIGVFHVNNQWIFEHFGRAESEGFKYLKSELKYTFKHNPLLVPKCLIATGAKLVGYKLGLHYQSLPVGLRKSCSMTKAYWSRA
ncbi:glycosyltransferase family A protein [Algoriphagus halophytocola]|uniref:Glycosyltransferase family 2 protein n=1 Tax=Algoriphagus halophytocola TaxID=2991499 RepID=A0ABY6ME09_9BACT|nr:MULTISPECIES: glycosyltransferase family A protein [unclassified Algoriphagus]UZD22007.1 glycosyltransferase family 2 protein [Algoriphagus sp. TR-M5]WBL43258.1 glycosyltransferase family A protein [Algoriphagus sp. TR-M9]